MTLEAALVDDLGADSLASVELAMALEEATGVSIDDDSLAQMKVVGDHHELPQGPQQLTGSRRKTISFPAGPLSMKGNFHDQPRNF